MYGHPEDHSGISGVSSFTFQLNVGYVFFCFAFYNPSGP